MILNFTSQPPKIGFVVCMKKWKLWYATTNCNILIDYQAVLLLNSRVVVRIIFINKKTHISCEVSYQTNLWRFQEIASSFFPGDAYQNSISVHLSGETCFTVKTIIIMIIFLEHMGRAVGGKSVISKMY